MWILIYISVILFVIVVGLAWLLIEFNKINEEYSDRMIKLCFKMIDEHTEESKRLANTNGRAIDLCTEINNDLKKVEQENIELKIKIAELK